MFLYADNNSPDFTDWFDIITKNAGLVILSENTMSSRLSPDEEKNVLNDYTKRFKSPKLTSELAYHIYRKP